VKGKKSRRKEEEEDSDHEEGPSTSSSRPANERQHTGGLTNEKQRPGGSSTNEKPRASVRSQPKKEKDSDDSGSEEEVIKPQVFTSLFCPLYTDLGASKVESSSWIWILVFLLHFDQNQIHIIFVECGEPGNPDPYLNFFLNAGFGSSQSECRISNLVADIDFLFFIFVQFSSKILATLI
jgi:hypothetical protein